MLIPLWLVAAPSAWAHRDDYLDETIVYQTLDRSELELEYWLDYGEKHHADGFFRHNVASEWGITGRWMVDGRATVRSGVGGPTVFDGGRLETRYRFGEEGEHPVDVAVSAELNREREEDGELVSGIEPRLILSRDLHEKLNLTLNLSEEIPLASGSAAFLVSGGIRYNWTPLFRIGAESHYDTDNQSGSIIPQLWLALRSGLTVKVGYSAGYGDVRENYGRLALEYEF